MELIIVMTIIALASAILIPRIGNSNGKLYQAQLKQLTAILNYNRRNSIILKRPLEVTLFPFNETKESTDQSSRIKKQWHSSGAYIEWKTNSGIKKNKIIKILFYPQGGATGGEIKLRQGRFVAYINVDSLTGRIALKEVQNETD